MGHTSPSKRCRCRPKYKLTATKPVTCKPVFHCCGNVCIRTIQPVPCVSRVKRRIAENLEIKNYTINTRSTKCPPVWTLCGQTQTNPNCILGNLENYDLNCEHCSDEKSIDKTAKISENRCAVSRCNMKPHGEVHKFKPDFHTAGITEKFYARHDRFAAKSSEKVIYFENEIQKFKDYDPHQQYCMPRYVNQTYGWWKNRKLLEFQNCKENIENDPGILIIINKQILEKTIKCLNKGVVSIIGEKLWVNEII